MRPPRGELREEIRRWAPRAVWLELAHQPDRLIHADGASQSVAQLAGRRVVAFCGIGNPDALRCSLDSLGCHVAAFHRFPDHHWFTHQDIAALERSLTQQPGVEAVVCTCKDLGQTRHSTDWPRAAVGPGHFHRRDRRSALSRIRALPSAGGDIRALSFPRGGRGRRHCPQDRTACTVSFLRSWPATRERIRR